jgi:hypothetical protein
LPQPKCLGEMEKGNRGSSPNGDERSPERSLLKHATQSAVLPGAARNSAPEGLAGLPERRRLKGGYGKQDNRKRTLPAELAAAGDDPGPRQSKEVCLRAARSTCGPRIQAGR